MSDIYFKNRTSLLKRDLREWSRTNQTQLKQRDS